MILREKRFTYRGIDTSLRTTIRNYGNEGAYETHEIFFYFTAGNEDFYIGNLVATGSYLSVWKIVILNMLNNIHVTQLKETRRLRKDGIK